MQGINLASILCSSIFQDLSVKPGNDTRECLEDEGLAPLAASRPSGVLRVRPLKGHGTLDTWTHIRAFPRSGEVTARRRWVQATPLCPGLTLAEGRYWWGRVSGAVVTVLLSTSAGHVMSLH